MLTVQVLASFSVSLGDTQLATCRPGDMITISEETAAPLIEKRLVRLMPRDEPAGEVNGDGAQGETKQPRRAVNRKKADEGPSGKVPAPDAEQG